MAFQSINGGVWLPNRNDESFVAIGSSTFVMDAAGELAAFVCEVPKSGNLVGFEAYIGAVTNPLDNGLRFSFQTPSPTTGLPDGVVDQFVTTAAGTPSAAGWLNPGNFDAPRAVTAGDEIALVIDNPSFTAGDSIAIGGMVASTDLTFPFAVRGTNTKDENELPIFALRYDDGSYGLVYTEVWPAQSFNTWALETDTSPDEAGLAFQVPFPCQLTEVAWVGRTSSASNAYDIIVYDNADNVVGSKTGIDGDIGVNTTSNRYHCRRLSSPVDIDANSTYRVVIKPTSSTLIMRVFYAEFASLALMQCIDGGPNIWATERTDAGAWTNFNNGTDGYRLPRISIRLQGFDDGVGGGGGGLTGSVFGGQVVR